MELLALYACLPRKKAGRNQAPLGQSLMPDFRPMGQFLQRVVCRPSAGAEPIPNFDGVGVIMMLSDRLAMPIETRRRLGIIIISRYFWFRSRVLRISRHQELCLSFLPSSSPVLATFAQISSGQGRRTAKSGKTSSDLTCASFASSHQFRALRMCPACHGPLPWTLRRLERHRRNCRAVKVRASVWKSLLCKLVQGLHGVGTRM